MQRLSPTSRDRCKPSHHQTFVTRPGHVSTDGWFTFGAPYEDQRGVDTLDTIYDADNQGTIHVQFGGTDGQTGITDTSYRELSNLTFYPSEALGFSPMPLTA